MKSLVFLPFIIACIVLLGCGEKLLDPEQAEAVKDSIRS